MAKKSTKKSAKKTSKKPVKKPAKKAVKKLAKKNKPVKKAKKASKKPAAKSVVAPPSNSINPYLTFAGNCEDAFNFYRSVFGGNFTYVGRFNEMPQVEGKPLSEADANKIMHISLPISAETVLMGSDSSTEFGGPIVAGTNFSISINAKNQDEADRLYNGLSQGGVPFMPMSKTFWGSYFGMFTDKYGINWMVSFG